MTEDLPPTIPEYFSGKNIFMTGGTGFIGKVLIEKILRSCPDVGKIYLLIRPKKDKSPEERIKPITDLPLFDVLKEKCPENLKKIIPVHGDVVNLGLGMSVEDRNTLIDQINIVYHIAASVRFDDPLKKAIILNIRGTREVLNLSKEMKNLEVFFHFSTAYCHTDKEVIDEKMYPALIDWKQIIEIAERADPDILDALTQKYIEPLPNTYTFSKSLAEHVVSDMCEGKIPAIIGRPSIVISTMLEPITGWIDNLNGPVAVLLASGKGVLRSIHAEPDVMCDYIPCDILVKATIIATWKKGMEKQNEKYKVTVYNDSNNKTKSITLREMTHIGATLCWDSPANGMMWYPNLAITKCKYYHYFRMIFYQLLPALFLDGLLLLLRHKPMLVKIQKKIFVSSVALEYFLCHEWVFLHRKAVSLEDSLLSSDREAFSFQRDHDLSDPFNYLAAVSVAGKKFLLKEDDSTKSKMNGRRMWLIAQLFNAMWNFIWVILLYKFMFVLVCKLYNIYMFFYTVKNDSALYNI